MAEFNLKKVMSGYTGTVASNKIYENDTTIARALGLQWARIIGNMNINTELKQLEVQNLFFIYYGLHVEHTVTFPENTVIQYVAGSSTFSNSIIAFDRSKNTFVWWDLRTLTEQYTSDMFVVAILNGGNIDFSFSNIKFNGKEFSPGKAFYLSQELSQTKQDAPKSTPIAGQQLTAVTENGQTVYKWQYPLHNAIMQRGGSYISYDEAAGTYTLNGVQCTYNEMADVYSYTSCGFSTNMTGILTSAPIKTTFPIYDRYFPLALQGVSLNSAFAYCPNLEIIHLLTGDAAGVNGLRTSDISYMLRQARKVKKVIGSIDCAYITNTEYAFLRADALESITLNRLNIDLNFADCPNLTRDTIIFTINNRLTTAGARAITITLHPQTFGRLSDEDKALASSKDITLAVASV